MIRRHAKHIFLLLTIASMCAMAADVSKEYRVKAGCLYNFTKFTEWPEHSFASATAPIEIGILGPNPFGTLLEDLVRGEAVRGHRLLVKYATNAADLKQCQIVFVSAADKNKARLYLADLNGANVLTVGESEGFAARGGIINFIIDASTGKVRFEINVEKARECELKISSQLLGMAKIVEKQK